MTYLKTAPLSVFMSSLAIKVSARFTMEAFGLHPAVTLNWPFEYTVTSPSTNDVHPGGTGLKNVAADDLR